jgi:hypothetical protein
MSQKARSKILVFASSWEEQVRILASVAPHKVPFAAMTKSKLCYGPSTTVKQILLKQDSQ